MRDLAEQQQMVNRFDISLPTNKMLKSRNNNLFDSKSQKVPTRYFKTV